jgi:TRAP-type transport system periplasmic protein
MWEGEMFGTGPRLFGLALVWLCANVVASAQQVTLKLHHFVPPTATAHVKFLAPWAEKIAKESNGRIKIQIYPALQLGGTLPQLLDQAADGVVDIVWALPGASAGRYPAFEVFELPFMTKTAQGASRALWEYVHANKIDQTEFKGLKLLATHVHDEGVIHTIDKPIRVMADFKGMKIRASNRWVTKLLAALGATPVGMPVAQVPDALSKHVIDGAAMPWEIIPSLKVHELVKFHSETDPQSRALYSTGFVVVMNPAKYASLPDDLKRVIDANSGAEFSAIAGKMWDDTAAPHRKLAEARGNQFTVVSREELALWAKATQSVPDEWVKEVNSKGFDGKALLKSAKDLIEKYDTK